MRLKDTTKVNLIVGSWLTGNMQKIKAILFDLDNTLSDFMQMKEESCKTAVHAMVAAGLNMNEKEAYAQLMQTYFALGLESDFAFTEFLKRVGQFDHKILAVAINAYLKTKTDFVKPYPNVKSVLEKLQKRNVVLCVVTDAPKTKAYQRLLIMGLEGHFKFVVGFEDTGSKKQTGLPLMLALEQLKDEILGVANSEVLMVGDSVERDLLPAKSLGLKTALSRYGQVQKETVTNGIVDYELADFCDLLRIV